MNAPTLGKRDTLALIYGMNYLMQLPTIYTAGEIDGTWQEHAARHAKLRGTLYIIASGEASIREHNFRRQLSAKSSGITNYQSNATDSD